MIHAFAGVLFRMEWFQAWLVSVATVTILCVHSVHSQWNHRIHVNSQGGSDSEECLMNNDMNSSCATLQHAITGLTNSSQILLHRGVHYLDNTINITNLHSISLAAATGTGAATTIVECLNASDTGIKFVGVSDLRISNLMFINCGSLSESTTRTEDYKSMALFRTAVYVLNSTDVVVDSVAFVGSRGIGLALFDTNGRVSVLHSNFTSNTVPEEERLIYNGGGGLYFEHTYCSPGKLSCDFRINPYVSNTTMNISNCHFTDNHATSLPGRSSTLIHQEKTRSRRLGHGAAISLSLKSISSDNHITVSSCTFEGSSARYGGAVNINLQDYVEDNEIVFDHCQFFNNHARDGGGGLFVGIFFYEVDSVLGNHIQLQNTVFVGNTGRYGGGAHFAISQMLNSNSRLNSLTFLNCEWRNNDAEMGGALLLVPEAWNTLTDGYLPIPVFTRCLFHNNSIISGSDSSSESASMPGTEGVLYSSAITLNFTERVVFERNFGTAVSIMGGSINVLNNAQASFIDNFGTRGGALALLEFSSLRLFPGSVVSFDRNTATEYGGAIYVSSHNELDFYFSRSCFIRYSDVRVPTYEWDTNVIFYLNYAGQFRPPKMFHPGLIFDPTPHRLPYDDYMGTRGHSIFAVSVLPCIRASDTTGNFTPTHRHAFPERIFDFHEYCNGDLCGVGTNPSTLSVRGVDFDGVLRMAPGEMKHLSLEAKDELNHTVYPVVTASTFPQSVSVDNSSFYVTDDRVQVNGPINTTFRLTLRTAGPKQVSVTLDAELTDCPPGLVYKSMCSETESYCSPSALHESKCVCSATSENQYYEGITKCSVDDFRGLLNIGYWAGCCGQNGTLVTAECPLGYCRSVNTDPPKPFYVLPKTCRDLDSFLCGPQNRSGVLCGKCADNHSVYFHSQRYSCHVCKNSYAGFFLYFLSELLPVTLVFLCIVSFNIHLTSGAWNGIILYAQIMDLFQVNSLQLFKLPPVIRELTSIYQFIFGWFNFDFFKFEDHLSFCLWNGATVMDVLAFKYITTAFAVSLLVLLILCFRSRCCSRYQTAWRRCQEVTGSSKQHRSWIIHGISAFLILSYAQCAKVSFQILSYIQLYGRNHRPIRKVVFLSGNTDYFSLSHLPYAIPALLILVLTTLPPVVLILYPNGIRLLNTCIGERNTDKLYHCYSEDGPGCCKAMNITRFKPLIDSFQGCYKDNYRYFAGLLFVYRFLMSLSFALSTSAITLYLSLEVLAIVMLAFHAWAQPYQRRFYNLLDTFVYANLAIVNGLSLFNYYWVTYSSDYSNLVVSLVFQLLLIFLPIIYLVVMCSLFNLTGCSRKARHSLHNINYQYVPLFEEATEDVELEESVSPSEGLINHSRLLTGSMLPFDEQHLPYRLFDDKSERKTT